MGNIKALKCRECGEEYEPRLKYVCDECFGPLDVTYEDIKINRETFVLREKTFWRYFELLPIQDKSNIVNIHAGFTPLQKAERLGGILGLKNLYIKNDTVNPTFSFKDRPAGVAVSRSKEIKLTAVGCASTGNLASSTAAHAAKADMPCYIFAPSDIEPAKISQALAYGAEFIGVDGTYDDANRLATQIADSKGIGMANINMRPYYLEGSKTLAYEVAEQLSWNVPDHVVIPVASGAMLHSICRGFEELHELGLINDISNLRVTAAQGKGCAPIIDAFKSNSEEIIPVEYPNTIAKSLAIGNPGDGLYALRKIKQYNGFAEDPNDEEIINAIILLAKTEGIFTEPAGGVAIAALKKLVQDGKIDRNESVTCYVTSNGLKATEVINNIIPKPKIVKPDIAHVSTIVR